MRTLLAAVVLVGSASGPAYAHGKGGEHIMGIVKQIQESVLTVEKDKTDITVALNAQTKFERDGAAITAKDLTVGERVVVHAQKDAGGTLVAQLIKVSKADAAKPTPGKKDRESEHKH